MRILFLWIINALAVLLAAYLVPGIHVTGFYAALLVALVLGLVNLVFRPLLVILTLPINILSLGLFTFIINGFLFWLVSTVVKGFEVRGFWAAVIGSLVVTVVSWFGRQLFPSR